MSRAEVRTGLAAFLAANRTAQLNTVLTARPKDIAGSAYVDPLNPSYQSGAVGVIVIERQTEQVIAFDGNGGVREITYIVAIEIFHESMARAAQDAMADFDICVDAVCDLLRRNPALGGNVPGLLQAAVESLDVQISEPELGSEDGGTVQTWAAIRFALQQTKTV